MKKDLLDDRRSIAQVVALAVLLIAGLLLFGCGTANQPAGMDFTRGIGVYPGDPAEDFSPELRTDSSNYRNLAFRRAAWGSSASDYNQTAHLVTDGIIETYPPRWMATTSSQPPQGMAGGQRGFGGRNAFMTINSPAGWVQYEFGGGDGPLAVDRVDISAFLNTTSREPREWTMVLSGSDDGASWRELGRQAGVQAPPQQADGGNRGRFGRGGLNQSMVLGSPAQFRFYRIDLSAGEGDTWMVRSASFFHDETPISFDGPYSFTSAWVSQSSEEEWVYVDLGAVCSFDRVVLHWIDRADAGKIQMSDDASVWRDIIALSAESGQTDDIHLDRTVNGRYVRVLMTEAASDRGYSLSEMEVYGRGGPVVTPHPAPAVKADGRLDLAGGNWKIQRDSQVEAAGEELSRAGFDDESWLVATVPGTVLVSYLNAGAIPNPNWGADQLQISDSFFYADFWYRDEFTAPASYDGNRMFLNFDGINWKAEVYLNGRYVGRIDGAFIRGIFDVTDMLVPGKTNAVAVRLIKNATPGNVKVKTVTDTGSNGGPLGADNPTYHAAIGWDWIPTIRGRDDGIWNDVYLTVSGPVTIDNPFVSTDLPLPDTTYADIDVEATLTNHTAAAVSGTLRGAIGPVSFEEPVSLAANESKVVKLDRSAQPALRMQNPTLWWPSGYGNPDMYETKLEFATDAGVSDTKSFMTGVREMAYSEEGGALRIWINGRRFIPRGGNWGFPESMLLYRGREYDTAVGYHADMNFTMIRNWVGMTGDDEFYEACDRHGVMVWQDFWLANPVDGPNPDDPGMFMANAADMVKRIRNHPSIGIYCGRNEGYPPEPIESGLRALVPDLHPGLHYISSSADDVVSGHGPYQLWPTEQYFAERATPLLHSEMGMPNIMPYESVVLTMPDSAMWPQGIDWGLHDFTLRGAQAGQSFINRLETAFGHIDNAKDWTTLAQWINYEGYRAMFEAQSRHRMGLIIWMSHPCWPSFVWQTYDYFFEPTAAYFGSKKASEPLHIQWNAATDSIEVVNYSFRGADGLTASMEVLNMDGTVAAQNLAALDSPEDSMTPVFAMEYPAGLTDVYYIRLKLMRGDELLSENFYWRGKETGNYQALWQLPKVALVVDTILDQKDANHWTIAAHITNPAQTPALMVRLKVVREDSGDRILPVTYEDNYVSLMPGEERTISMEFRQADTRGERPALVVEGFNVAEQE